MTRKTESGMLHPGQDRTGDLAAEDALLLCTGVELVCVDRKCLHATPHKKDASCCCGQEMFLCGMTDKYVACHIVKTES